MIISVNGYERKTEHIADLNYRRLPISTDTRTDCSGKGDSYRWNSIGCNQPPILHRLDSEAKTRIKQFNHTVAKRLGEGAGSFANKREYQKALEKFVDLMFFTDDSERRFLFVTFHWKPYVSELNAERTLKHLLNSVDRAVFKSQHSNGRKKWLSTFPVIEGTTPISKHYHLLLEDIGEDQVKDALLSCWTKLRSTRWCFLDYTPDIRGLL